MELIAENVERKIKGRVVLCDVNLRMESGRVYGIVGRNGSGKTMLFRALSGLMWIDGGVVRLGARQLHRDFAVLPGLGIVLENAGLYPELTGRENLKYLAGVNKKVREAEIDEAIRRVGLNPKDRRSFRKYSLGMKQRIILAQAIMERPDILFLDEPTNALDEGGVEQIRRVVLEEKERGALVVLASHNREDIELLADEIFHMSDGRLKKE